MKTSQLLKTFLLHFVNTHVQAFRITMRQSARMEEGITDDDDDDDDAMTISFTKTAEEKRSNNKSLL